MCQDVGTRPPMDYPQFFYGFVAVAVAWQIAFLVIGSDPVRFRPLMIPSVLEKLGYVVTLAVLYFQSRISAADAQAAVPDLLLGILFIVAFVKTHAGPYQNHYIPITERAVTPWPQPYPLHFPFSSRSLSFWSSSSSLLLVQ